jgi:hypothetical protein
MIININRRFIFVANLRAASTSIEDAIGVKCGIAIDDSALGKHFCIHEMEERFKWLFDVVPLNRFFVFGVLRDPLYYLISLYNFHRQDAFDKQISSTKNIEFEEFYYKWLDHPNLKWQMLSQVDRFKDKNEKVCCNYFIRYRQLVPQLQEIREHLKLPKFNLPSVNASPRGLTTEDIQSSCVKDIANRYEQDYYYLENMTGKLLK